MKLISGKSRPHLTSLTICVFSNKPVSIPSMSYFKRCRNKNAVDSKIRLAAPFIDDFDDRRREVHRTALCVPVLVRLGPIPFGEAVCGCVPFASNPLQ